VQLKKSNQRPDGRWMTNTWKRVKSKAVPYDPKEIDCLITFAIGDWYFFTDIATLGTSVAINPGKNECRYDKLRGNWAAIGLPNQPLRLV
jgi:hypothetical protein